VEQDQPESEPKPRDIERMQRKVQQIDGCAGDD
jgi:hypothetical protein